MTKAILILLSTLISFPLSFSTTSHTLSRGSSLSVEKPQDVLISPNAMYSAGFLAVGFNAYCFAVWFTGETPTIVWMANRDSPVNGKHSELSLLNSGNLLLTDGGQFNAWGTNTSSSSSSLHLLLYDTGNLVLHEIEGRILWQSFDFPTNTLLPQQVFTRFTKLVSSRSESNHSSGFYELFFDNDNVLRLLYDGPEISSIYWPDPGLVSWEAGRSTYNGSRIAVLDSLGNFNSSDDLSFVTSDYGMKIQRRLVLDFDGNIRVYSRKNGTDTWYVSWQAILKPCIIHGICGANSICSYDHISGRKCSCLPGHRLKNDRDWSGGCELKENFSCNKSESHFIQLPHVDFYGYDFGFYPNYTLEQCLNLTSKSCNYKGFQYKFIKEDGHFNCYPKTQLLNGYYSPDFEGAIFLKLAKGDLVSYEDLHELDSNTHCSNQTIEPERNYEEGHENGKLNVMLWFAPGLGFLEIICILLVWCFLKIRSLEESDAYEQGYLPGGTGFRKYSYSELKKATQNFSQEIGRGSGGTVYKGELSDERVAAIKKLNEAYQGEEEFFDEASIIGRLNHMNLIKMWGFCAEGKHRLLVYEYMENGSLAENLMSNNALDFNRRFNIALGMARGLAYLHEECLEWILHCDVKPQNILLDSNYQPKVADFGLSKLLNRNDHEDSNFSTIRGTRGYMAPEWIFSLPITSKVDVYSYGIVVLEMVTGKSPTMGLREFEGGEGKQHWRLVTWVRELKAKGLPKALWLKQIKDPMIGSSFDLEKMDILVEVALQCAEEDKDSRPTMRQVVEMLQIQQSD